ncbi:MAG: hypothetical protein HOM68_26605 [Gemmatimonadetes bacterium]|jgi:septal ring factor EnvC (AmiA/AmiB activator)|nr:hypothetical protein [Gemmatimonadota bacterium]MBT4612210.1 hypothetical protein [Gemmatimonadota bacterium]MBT5060141.1 hypothetical protein [Gemmatimonadota bacterium]MBT5141429.1 hypothetical protein [Gemmatimonadota bacterium]MBT5590662.1 hypothetical protein [Gemmatimonadota bacterium]
MSELLLIAGGSAVFLLIVCLITRESTEGKLRAMRMELMSLRSKERTLEDQVKAVQKTESQIREGLMRMERTQDSTGQVVSDLFRKLTQLYEFVRQEPMPAVPDPGAAIAQEEEVAA